VGQVRALAGVFGIEPSYLLDRGEPVFDGELVKALRDGTVREAALEISQLSERDRQLTLGIMRQFEMPGDATDRRASRLIGALLHAGPNKPSQLLWFTIVKPSTCARNPGG